MIQESGNHKGGIYAVIWLVYTGIREVTVTTFKSNSCVLFEKIMHSQAALFYKIKLCALFPGVLGHIYYSCASLDIGLEFPGLWESAYL